MPETRDGFIAPRIDHQRRIDILETQLLVLHQNKQKMIDDEVEKATKYLRAELDEARRQNQKLANNLVFYRERGIKNNLWKRMLAKLNSKKNYLD